VFERLIECVSVVTSRPERELIAAAQQGDAEAFGELYDLFSDRVYRHIYFRVGSQTDSEDLTQQTFLKAWRAIGRYQITGVPFVAWLLTIGHNTVISHFRGKREHSILDWQALEIDGGEDPHGTAVRHFNQRAVRKAITQLPPEQQQVVVMRYLEDLGYDHIAAVLNKSENNVRVILHRALKRMRGLLDEPSI
jgi:RNA polymerase sigma-70 factor (ECF subfamily)